MLIFALIAILLIALIQIVRVLLDPPVPEQSLPELEFEMVTLDAECTLAVQRSREELIILAEPNPNLG
jgi:hypothetical protein